MLVGSGSLAAGAERVGHGQRVVEHHDLLHGHAGLGERAGLVDADDVDPRERLDRGHVLDKRLLLREADDRHGHGGAREEHEPSGTIVMTPGTVPAIEAQSPSFARYCEMNRNTPTGTRNHDTTLMKRWIE